MNVDPIKGLEEAAASASSLEEAARVLEEVLGGGYSVWTDGSLYYIRQLVARINGLKIEIYAKEHPPPHFHVKGGDVNAVFSLADGSYINGAISGREMALVQWWYKRSRPALVQAWNNSRPSDCPVGPLHA